MGLFKRKKKPSRPDNLTPQADFTPEDPWFSKVISHEQGQVFLELCIREVKSRGLDIPLLLYPFRPDSDHASTRRLINRAFTGQLRGPHLKADLQISEPLVLVGAIKWVLSRLEGGLLSVAEYELFMKAEQQLNYAADTFSTLITTIVISEERRRNINNFLDFLAAVASHVNENGHSGRKLARVCASLIFRLHCTGTQRFDEGYKVWHVAADAAEHLFLAYIRDLSSRSFSGISMLPLSLQKIVDTTPYPIEHASEMRSAIRITLTAEEVSTSPNALIERLTAAKEKIPEIESYELVNDPQLSDECLGVMRGIEAVISMHSERQASDAKDAAWIDFAEHGFDLPTPDLRRRHSYVSTRSHIKPRRARPVTPDWSQFIDLGFKVSDKPMPMLPLHLHLPDITPSSPRTPRHVKSKTCETSTRAMQIDEAVWGAWIISLASESNPLQKGFFGRCLILQPTQHETWLIVEEVVHGTDRSIEWKPNDTIARTRQNSACTDSRVISVVPIQAAEARVQTLIRGYARTSCELKSVPYPSMKRGTMLDQEYVVPEALTALKWTQEYDRNPGVLNRSSVFLLTNPKEPMPVETSEPEPSPRPSLFSCTPRLGRFSSVSDCSLRSRARESHPVIIQEVAAAKQVVRMEVPWEDHATAEHRIRPQFPWIDTQLAAAGRPRSTTTTSTPRTTPPTRPPRPEESVSSLPWQELRVAAVKANLVPPPPQLLAPTCQLPPIPN